VAFEPRASGQHTDASRAAIRRDTARVRHFYERAAALDSVVVTLALCSIPDQRQAVREMRRVLRDGGRLVWLEHVRSPVGPVRAVEWLLEPLSLRLAADSLLREPLEPIAAAGLQVEQLERSAWGIIERGVARASGTATISGR